MKNQKKVLTNFNKNDFNVSDVFNLNKFVVPKFAQIIYWINLVLIAFISLGSFFSGLFTGNVLAALGGLVFLVLSPLFVRLFFEPMLVSFKSNEYLRDIRDYLYEKDMNSKQEQGDNTAL